MPISLSTVITSVRRHLKLLLPAPVIGGMLGLLWFYQAGRAYEARGAFVPQPVANSPLKGLAAQFGFDAGGDASQSPDFYEALIRTDGLLSSLVRQRYAVSPEARDSITLAAHYKIATKDTLSIIQRTIRRLRSDIAVSSSRRTGIVTFSVTMRDPFLTKQVADRLLREVTNYNQRSRQSQAHAERLFVESRQQQAAEDLRQAEYRLQAFLDQNRVLRDSPKLVFESERLEREVARRNAVFITLSTSFEQARVDEVRDTPVLTVVDAPQFPTMPTGRRSVAAIAGATLFTSLLTLVIVLRAIWTSGDFRQKLFGVLEPVHESGVRGAI